LAPAAIIHGEARLDDKGLIFLYSRTEEPDRPYRAFVKATALKHEVYLQSIHRIQLKQIARIVRESTAVR
jgi:hypothetical protein